MQGKNKLYVDKNTPNVDKNTPNVDEKPGKIERWTPQGDNPADPPKEEAKRKPKRQQTTWSRKTPNTPENGDDRQTTTKGTKTKP